MAGMLLTPKIKPTKWHTTQIPWFKVLVGTVLAILVLILLNSGGKSASAPVVTKELSIEEEDTETPMKEVEVETTKEVEVEVTTTRETTRESPVTSDTPAEEEEPPAVEKVEKDKTEEEEDKPREEEVKSQEEEVKAQEEEVKPLEEEVKLQEEPTPPAQEEPEKVEEVVVLVPRKPKRGKKKREPTLPPLEDVIKKIEVDNTVTYTVVAEGFVKVFHNWALSFILATKGGRRHNFLAFATTAEVYKEIEEIFPGHGYYFGNKQALAFLESSQKAIDGEKSYDKESRNFQLAAIRRPLYGLLLNKLGYNALFTEVDSIFLRDPWPILAGEYDVYVLYDRYGEPPPARDEAAYKVVKYEQDHQIGSSIVYFKAGVPSTVVLNAWLAKARTIDMSVEKTEVTDKVLFNRAFWANVNRNLDKVNIGVLPVYKFPSSYFYFGYYVKDGENDKHPTPWRDLYKKGVVYVETSWMQKLDVKIQTLKDLGMWHLPNEEESSA